MRLVCESFPLIHPRLPKPRRALKHLAQPNTVQRLINESWRVIIDAELLASDSQTHVNHPDTYTHPQGALWHRQCKETARVRAGSGQQLLDRGVTSNGAIQRHDIRRGNPLLQFNEIPLPLLYPVCHPHLLRQSASGRDIGGGSIHAGGRLRPRQ